MVWQLRMWEGGDPVAQADQCEDLGLEGVWIKITDGRWDRWGGAPQNYELLPGTVAELNRRGITIGGWGWTYAGRWIAGVFFPSTSIAFEEGQLAGSVMIKHGMTEFMIDAEREFNRSGMEDEAEAYMRGFMDTNPTAEQLLCSYRFPKTYQPNFPVEAFEPFMEGWAPQVYFLGDTREDGGARQLETSFNQYMGIKELPFHPVAPTYDWRGWRATYKQLTAFFDKAKELGCQGVSVWDLPQASDEQLRAIRDYQWGVIQPPTNIPERIRTEADKLDQAADDLRQIADEIN